MVLENGNKGKIFKQIEFNWCELHIHVKLIAFQQWHWAESSWKIHHTYPYWSWIAGKSFVSSISLYCCTFPRTINKFMLIYLSIRKVLWWTSSFTLDTTKSGYIPPCFVDNRTITIWNVDAEFWFIWQYSCFDTSEINFAYYLAHIRQLNVIFAVSRRFILGWMFMDLFEIEMKRMPYYCLHSLHSQTSTIQLYQYQ